MADTEQTLTVDLSEEAKAELAALEATYKAERETLQIQMAAMQMEFAQARELLEAERTRRTELELEARRTRFAATAEGWYAAPGAVALMESLATAFGEDSAELAAFVERERAHAAQGKTAALFDVKGSDAPGVLNGDPTERIRATAAARAKERDIPYAQALQEELASNPQAYEAYRRNAIRSARTPASAED
jgi:hypothetical protein